MEEVSLPHRHLPATFLGADQGRVRPRAAGHLTGEEGSLGPRTGAVTTRHLTQVTDPHPFPLTRHSWTDASFCRPDSVVPITAADLWDWLVGIQRDVTVLNVIPALCERFAFPEPPHFTFSSQWAYDQLKYHT